MPLESEKRNILLWYKYTYQYVKLLTFHRICDKIDFVRYIYTLWGFCLLKICDWILERM